MSIEIIRDVADAFYSRHNASGQSVSVELAEVDTVRIEALALAGFIGATEFIQKKHSSIKDETPDSPLTTIRKGDLEPVLANDMFTALTDELDDDSIKQIGVLIPAEDVISFLGRRYPESQQLHLDIQLESEGEQ